jgi:hypothetical protein
MLSDNITVMNNFMLSKNLLLSDKIMLTDNMLSDNMLSDNMLSDNIAFSYTVKERKKCFVRLRKFLKTQVFSRQWSSKLENFPCRIKKEKNPVYLLFENIGSDSLIMYRYARILFEICTVEYVQFSLQKLWMIISLNHFCWKITKISKFVD